MKRLSTIALPLLALPLVALAACGGSNAANDIITTNTGNVLLNDAQANQAIRGDNETAADTMSDPATANAATAGNAQ